MITLVIFDIDGTLIPMFTHVIAEETKQAIIQLKRKGILVALATGRQYSTIQDELKQLGFDYYLCGNGACITDVKGIPLILHSFDEKTVEDLTKDFIAFQAPLIFRYVRGAINANPNVPISDYNKGFFKPNQTNKQNNYFKPAKNEFPYAALTNLEQCQFMQLKMKYDSLRFVMTGGGMLCDITKKGIHKGKGLQDLCVFLGINKQDSIAFGNDSNDIELLAEAGIGVAMGDAQEEVKIVADYISGTCKKLGVVTALRQFNLIH